MTDITRLEESFGKLGIALRDEQGNVRATSDILYDISELWRSMCEEGKAVTMTEAMSRGTTADTRYMVTYRYEQTYDEDTSYERVLGIFDSKERALGELKHIMRNHKQDCLEWWDKAIDYQDEEINLYGFTLVREKQFWEESHEFRVEEFVEGVLNTENMAE